MTLPYHTTPCYTISDNLLYFTLLWTHHFIFSIGNKLYFRHSTSYQPSTLLRSMFPVILDARPHIKCHLVHVPRMTVMWSTAHMGIEKLKVTQKSQAQKSAKWLWPNLDEAQAQAQAKSLSIWTWMNEVELLTVLLTWKNQRWASKELIKDKKNDRR